MSESLDSARRLIAATRPLYSTDEAVQRSLDEMEQRCDQPLRVALVGSVKAGKSTLLNGLLGERIAPTDARECTRIVTWYRFGKVPQVRAQLANGDTVTIPARRQRERLELDLGELTAEEFERLDVTWPAPGIRGITLIDTPGIASISQDVSQQTNEFLLPEQGAAGADAVVYLLRSLHEADIEYMRAMQERTRHGNASMGAVAVLSRADELGSSRLTAMFTINQAVERLRNHPDLQGTCETIVPVAGLMGTGAMTLRQADFVFLRDLAARSAQETEALLMSAERFIAARDEWLPSERVRLDVVDRFGLYGVRIAVAVIRGGIDNADDLAAELLRRSGLEELRRVIDVHFTQRQDELKAHAVVLALHRLVRQHPVVGGESIVLAAEEHMARSHTFTEMQLLGRIASGKLDLSEEQLSELERLVGGRGATPAMRLGFDDEEPGRQKLLDSAITHLSRWRTLRNNPLLDRETFRACAIAERSCEALIVPLMEEEAGAHP